MKQPKPGYSTKGKLAPASYEPLKKVKFWKPKRPLGR